MEPLWKEIKTDFFSRDYLFEGNQGDCNGYVDPESRRHIIKCLNQNSPIGITFNVNKGKDILSGGTCTAMSLEFLESYFKFKKSLTGRLGSKSFMLMEYIEEIGSLLKESSETMRTRQAAFNAIEITKEYRNKNDIDHASNKIQALANFHDLVIKEKCFVSEDCQEICTLTKFEKLPFGQYIVRIIKPSENRRMEHTGHTLIYIKDEKLRLCYDPNNGLKNLGVLHDAANLDFIFRSVSKEFSLSQLSCYRVEPLSFIDR